MQDPQTPIKVPAELCQTDCSATIIDTWYRSDSDCHDQIRTELKLSNVVLLIYDISKPESIDRITSFWCEFISETTDSPIVIVGSKADQRPNSETRSLEDLMRDIIKKYKQCEMILECSALNSINIKEVFTFAQQVVLYPTSPLYDTTSKDLTEEYKRALVLVFLRCDRGKRNYLTDADVIQLHSEVFAAHLNEEDVARIKEVIKQELESGVNDYGITLQGFYHLQKMMIKRQKINVCWNLLSHYGFNKDLNLEIEFTLNKSADQSVELTRVAISHLEHLFNKYAENGILLFDSFSEIFKAVACPPWEPKNSDRAVWRKVFDMVPSHGEGFYMHDWLGLWHLLTLQDYRNALLYLVYTGCDLPYNDLFLATHEREVMEVNYRRVFCGFVLSDEGEENKWIIEKFIDNSISDDNLNTRWACKVVEESEVLWENKFLVLVAYPPGFTGFAKSVHMCDVAVIVSESGRINSEEIVPATVPRVRIKESAPEVSTMKNFKLMFTYAFKPFEGIDPRVKEQLMRNRKEKRTYLAQVLALVGLAVGVTFFILKKKIN